VQRIFLSDDSQDEPNLQTMRDSIKSNEESRALLELYRRVYEKPAVVAEERRDPTQQRLILIGLVISEQGLLRVRNEIYRRVFDLGWIEENMPANLAQKILGLFRRRRPSK